MKKCSMRKCPQCGKLHKRPYHLCNRCYINQPDQIEKRRERDKRYYKKLSEKWKEERSELVCKRCDKKFAGNKSNQKYCSPECCAGRSKWIRKKINCYICKTLFLPRTRRVKCCKKCFHKNVYKQRNKDKKRHYDRVREARMRGAEGNFTFEEWENLKKKFNYQCAICKKKEPEIKITRDHIIPISKNGSNNIENIQPLCKGCNSKKSNKLK